MPRSFIDNEEAVSIGIGYVLSLIVLLIFTGGITGAFYQFADSSSIKSMRIGSTDLGSQIARDITNMYITSEDSSNQVTLNVTREIPLTLGGRGYSIQLKNSSEPGGMASIDIKDGSFFSNSISTTTNSINTKEVNISRSKVVYSGSGTIHIRMRKINAGTIELWIE